MICSLGFNTYRQLTRSGTLTYCENRNAEVTGEPMSAETPTLLFLHGFGGGSSSYEWSLVYPAFRFGYRVVVPDLLGWGHSEHLTRDYTLADYEESLSDFVDAIAPTPVTAIASSLTAGIVVRLAVRQPDRWRSLILVEPSGLSDFGNDYRRSPFAQVISTPIVDRFLYQSVLATPWGIRSFLERRQFAQPSRISPEMVDAYLESAQQPNAEYSALSFVRGDLCFDLADDLPRLTVPTAMLWGTEAQFTDLALGKRLAALNPEAIRIFEEIPDTGLTPHLELPAATIGHIQRILRQFAQV